MNHILSAVLRKGGKTHGEDPFSMRKMTDSTESLGEETVEEQELKKENTLLDMIGMMFVLGRQGDQIGWTGEGGLDT